jgi:hypothetical protein
MARYRFNVAQTNTFNLTVKIVDPHMCNRIVVTRNIATNKDYLHTVI